MKQIHTSLQSVIDIMQLGCSVCLVGCIAALGAMIPRISGVTTTYRISHGEWKV